MNYALLENVQALLDWEKIPQEIQPRVEYLTRECKLPPEETLQFLLGERNLPHRYIKQVADKFEVDIEWLVGKN